jgi:hypothetical protein
VSFKGNGLNNQTASYTGVLLDAGKTVMMNVATANTFTIPASGSVAYELGTVLRVSNKGAGTTTVQPNVGVVLNGGNIALTQYQSCEVQLVAADIWVPTVKPTTVTASGLTLISTTTFSPATSVSFNNCFSATYDNYIAKCTITNSTTINNLGFRLRAAGTDATGANYNTQFLAASSTTVNGARTAGATSIAQIALLQTPDIATMTFNFFSPALAAGTTIITESSREPINSISIFNQTGYHTVSSAYDGFTLIAQSGNISGTMKIYGLQNS